MEEISSFINTSLSSGSSSGTESAKAVSETFQGIATIYQRIADELKAKEDGGKGGEVKGLLDFAEKGKVAVTDKRRRA
jgi:hypothetical protein